MTPDPTDETGRGLSLQLPLGPRGDARGRQRPKNPARLPDDGSQRIYLFPISSRVPQPIEAGVERLYEIVPEIEQRRIGLGPDKASHLILDDYNKVRPDELYDFESLTPVGSFSARFLEKVARRFMNALQERRPIAGRTRR